METSPEDTKPDRCFFRESKQIFRGADSRIDTPRPDLTPAPKWRDLESSKALHHRGESYCASPHEIDMVNAALYLRRPLLVTGPPGVGKSSLAHAVARELDLGDVLIWPITSRSTRKEGLYDYDAVARFQEVALAVKQREALALDQREAGRHSKSRASTPSDLGELPDIGRYIKLGPLGTAFLWSQCGKQRVLLIDELDKSSIDLPNDLLHLFEEGSFEISEIARLPDAQRPVGGVRVRGHDDTELPVEPNGKVRCKEFPLVIITSNGEREFPPPFLRRCLRLDIREPDRDKLRAIVKEHLELDLPEKVEDAPPLEGQALGLLDYFIELRKNKVVATDQLLNALHLVKQGIDLSPEKENQLRNDILKALSES